jgi:hypothetical protein
MRQYGSYSYMWGRWGSVDEVSFGPRREIRLPSRYRRAFAVMAAVVAAGAIAAGAALAVTTAGTRDATSAPRAASAPAAAQSVKVGSAPCARGARPLGSSHSSDRPNAVRSRSE